MELIKQINKYSKPKNGITTELTHPLSPNNDKQIAFFAYTQMPMQINQMPSVNGMRVRKWTATSR